VLLSSIIILATVVSLYIPFSLSSDRLIFTCIFLNFLSMVFHARMIDVQTSNHKSRHALPRGGLGNRRKKTRTRNSNLRFTSYYS
jgi:hypothetical protein